MTHEPPRAPVPDVEANAPVARFAAIDALRGLALLGMFVFHFTWDLGFFRFISPEIPYSPGFMLFGHTVAATFLALAGASLVLAARSGFNPRAFWKRFSLIALAAACISLATYVAFPDSFIFFGILHCIAAASLVCIVFLRAPLWLAALAATAILAAPTFIVAQIFDAPAFWWVGLGYDEPPTNDWRPFFPWVGFALAGTVLMRFALLRVLPARFTNWRPQNRVMRALVGGGRHSLLVYLVHQPIFLALVYGATLFTSPEEARYQRACETQCARSGGEARFCARACACVLPNLKRENLWRKVLQNALSPEENAAFTALSQQCAREASSP